MIWGLCLLCSGLMLCICQQCIRKVWPVLLEGWCQIQFQFSLPPPQMVQWLFGKWQLTRLLMVRSFTSILMLCTPLVSMHVQRTSSPYKILVHILILLLIKKLMLSLIIQSFWLHRKKQRWCSIWIILKIEYFFNRFGCRQRFLHINWPLSSFVLVSLTPAYKFTPSSKFEQTKQLHREQIQHLCADWSLPPCKFDANLKNNSKENKHSHLCADWGLASKFGAN